MGCSVPDVLALNTRRLVEKLRRQSLAQDVDKFFKACSICALSRTTWQLPSGLLDPLPIPHQLWSHIALDSITDLQVSEGNTTILAIVDWFSKACHLIAPPKLSTVMETASDIFKEVFRHFGLHEDIGLDWGVQFTACVLHALCTQLNINVGLSPGYYPQSSDQVGRMNQEISRFLTTLQ